MRLPQLVETILTMLANMVATQLNKVTMLAWEGSTGWGTGAAKAKSGESSS